MNSMMEFPKTPLEFVESYKFKDSNEIYTNGSELIQVFRVKQMLEHYYEPLKEKTTPKKPKYTYFNNKLVNYHCPCCGEAQGLNVNKRWNRFCPVCGQALDWNEE